MVINIECETEKGDIVELQDLASLRVTSTNKFHSTAAFSVKRLVLSIFLRTTITNQQDWLHDDQDLMSFLLP